MADDARSLPNTALLETSFLYGANATFVEEMAARYARDPNSVDASWRAFFDQVRDDPQAAERAVKGPSWYRPELAQPQTTETTALLDGNWAGLAAKLHPNRRVQWARFRIQQNDLLLSRCELKLAVRLLAIDHRNLVAIWNDDFQLALGALRPGLHRQPDGVPKAGLERAPRSNRSLGDREIGLSSSGRRITLRQQANRDDGRES